MLNLYPYLCDDPDMDLSPIREKSERLYRDILRERQYYAEHPECTNIHFFHKVRQNVLCSYWVDRWGVMLSHNLNRWKSLRGVVSTNPALHGEGYVNFCWKINKIVSFKLHRVMADIFLPNTDFTRCQIDHLNSEHLDNTPFNLERVTPEENIRRRWVTYFQRKGQPVPWMYQSYENYLKYLQTKKSKL